jgi:activating signal cointegrator 1
MKALSVWQPRASTIASGAKTIETRSWFTHYRGSLIIHAGKRRVELADMVGFVNWRDVLGGLTLDGGIWDALPFGAAIAVCELVDCRATQTFVSAELDRCQRPRGDSSGYGLTERQLGDFTPGRFGWVLRNARPLIRPVLWRGAQGLFEIPSEVLPI